MGVWPRLGGGSVFLVLVNLALGFLVQTWFLGYCRILELFTGEYGNNIHQSALWASAHSNIPPDVYLFPGVGPSPQLSPPRCMRHPQEADRYNALWWGLEPAIPIQLASWCV